MRHEDLEVYVDFSKFGFGAMYVFPHNDHVAIGGGGPFPKKPIKDFKEYTQKFFEKKGFNFENAAFGDAKVYLIPKRNVTLRGSKKWKNMLRSFLTGTFAYLKEYFRRNNSESGFSSDKRRFGWTVRQRKDERIDVAQFTILLWHNLFLLA